MNADLYRTDRPWLLDTGNRATNFVRTGISNQSVELQGLQHLAEMGSEPFEAWDGHARTEFDRLQLRPEGEVGARDTGRKSEVVNSRRGVGLQSRVT